MRSITRFKNFAWLFAVIIIAGISFEACKKNVDAENTVHTAVFNSAFVKEWYYDSFKKSTEWSSSPEHGKKLPDWKHGTKTKIANWEAIEFPLVKSISSFSIPAAQLTAADCKRVANASIAKVVFIKGENNEMAVREVDYIPDWEYLQSKKFDISAVNTGTANDFTGRIVIKKWDGSVISTKILVNGKAIKTAKKIDVAAKSETANNSLDGCTTYEICEFIRDCEIQFYGDATIVETCNEWNNTTCWYEQECTGGGGNDCENYGIGCGGGGSDGGDANTNQAIIDSLQGHPCAQAVLMQLPSINETVKNILQNVFGVNDDINMTFKPGNNLPLSLDGEASCYGSTGGAYYNCTILINPHVLDSSSQDYIVATFIHEAIHAYIQYKRAELGANSPEFQAMFPIYSSNIGNDPQHNVMANQYVDMMADVIMAYNPNISLQDATNLAWGGLNKSTVWSLQDTVSINNMNRDAKFPTANDYAIHNLSKCE